MSDKLLIKPMTPPSNTKQDLRQPAEILYAEELDALIKAEKHPVPAGWRMSPRSVGMWRHSTKRR